MTSSKLGPVLLIEDMEPLASVYRSFLEDAGFEVEWADTLAAGLGKVDSGRFPLALLDLTLPDGDGFDLLRHVRAAELPTTVVIITGDGSIDTAVEGMREGAYDFIVKPFPEQRLVTTARNAIEHNKLQNALVHAHDQVTRQGFQGFVGSSLAMQAVYRIVEAAAASSATVFITGESGTGKEVCAEAIHRLSARRDRHFVPLNCGAIPENLIESEIFGHVKGAFTGAVTNREGAAREAAGGTLFLDEICETSPDFQTKLLRFVQTGMVQPVGSARAEKVDVRFICATNRDPWAEVEAGRFREDLYYRLHVIPIHLPPLRERDDDVVEIARVLLAESAREEGKRFKRFTPEAEARLKAYDWPGNVRQLQNVLRNAVVLNDGEALTAEMLPPPLSRGPAGKTGSGPASLPMRGADDHPPGENGSGPDGAAAIKPLWQVEKQAIEAAIAQCDGNIPRAASLLEISPSTIYRKRQSWQAADGA